MKPYLFGVLIVVIVITLIGITGGSAENDLAKSTFSKDVVEQEEVVDKVRPLAYACGLPTLKYKVGKIDPRFNITEQELRGILKEVEKEWNTKAKGRVLEYSSSGFPVDFIYDWRQENLDKMRADKIDYDGLVKEVASAKEVMLKFQGEYDKDRAVIDARFDEFNARVDAINSEARRTGRNTSPQIVRMMDILGDELDKDQDLLEIKHKEFFDARDAYNNAADVHNRVVHKYKLGVKRKAGTMQSREGSFGGMSIRVVDSIHVYEFKSRSNLQSLLLHEFGHAIGLEHVDDKSAIMYPEDQGVEPVLTAVDVKGLADVCGQTYSFNLFNNNQKLALNAIY